MKHQSFFFLNVDLSVMKMVLLVAVKTLGWSTETGEVRLLRLSEANCSFFNELKAEGGYQRKRISFDLLKREQEQQAPLQPVASTPSHSCLDIAMIGSRA